MNYTIENNILKLTVAEYGAEIKSLIRKSDNKEIMWQADAAFWGRTSPVLFPVVGSYYQKKSVYDGKTYEMGQHGFARDMDFALINQTDNKLTFVLRGETFHDGRKLTARTAPISVEIDHARDSALVTESLRRIYVGDSIQKLAGCERDDLAREILSRSLIVFSLHRIHVTVIVFDSSRLRFGLRRLLRRAFLSAGSEHDCREKS